MDTERVEELMAAMADGDSAAVFALRAEYGERIAAVVRMGIRKRRTSCPHEEIEALVVDVCLMLYDTARSWSPEGGALPWFWAEKRIGNLIDCHLGQFTDPLDEHRVQWATGDVRHSEPARSTVEPHVLEVLDRLASADPGVRLLQEALGTVASARDGELFLELGIQDLLGDRSPAVTVGALLGLRPDAVRQQHRRVRSRLRDLAGSDTRFAPLADLALVA